jgi:hypothetical protein
MVMTPPQSLAFALKLPSSLQRVTTCDLSISLGDVPVWPVPGEFGRGLEVQIDDLLAYLTEFWKPLMLRQVYPIDVNPSRPSDLRREAANRWAEQPPELVDREEDAVSAFEEAHNLARAFAGLFDLPPFWLLRSGDDMLCDNGTKVWRLPFADVRRALSEIGSQISERLFRTDPTRWSASAQAWENRDSGDGSGLLAWSTGINRDVAGELIADGTLEPPKDFEDAANDNDELRIAARMAGALPVTQIRQIISLARKFEKHGSDALRQLSFECNARLDDLWDKRPFAQGEAAARVVRNWLSASDKDATDIFVVMQQLGIEVQVLAAEPSTLEGLAIWGERHGPGALLNTSSTRILPHDVGNVVDSPGARLTLAHELCHLLLDGRHAFSAIEVLRSRMPLGIEQRARSFAGEFLLPSKVAADAWFEAGRPEGRKNLEKVVSDLARRFGVTWSVVTWKLEHGLASYDVDLSPTLDAIAPSR